MTRTSDLKERLEKLENENTGNDDAPKTFAEAIKQAVEEENET